MTRERLILAINAAELAGFTHYAQSLRALFQRLHGFSLVTGRDFGRSIAWAKAQPPGPLSNEALRAHVAAHHARQASPSPCSG